MTHKKWLATASVVAMAAAAPASAQQRADNSSTNVETVVVSASRITVAGYEAPTPVMVLNAAKINRDAHPILGDALRQLPSVGQSISTSTGSNGGTQAGLIALDQVNLRMLGVTRTLVLFDGKRVVPANINGGVDLATMPSSLVERVDIVTGGASAAWGSDAVAGVVNVILNKNFTGFAANLLGGTSHKNDVRSVKAEASFGTDFHGTRGHFIISGSYTMSPDILFAGRREYAWNTHLFDNPAFAAGNGQPKLIHVQNVGMSQATRGGLIQGCGASAAVASRVNCPLKNIQFIGPEAAPKTFTPGLIKGPYANGPSAESAMYTGGAIQGTLAIPYHQVHLFNFNRYRLTDNITASVELSYGKQSAQSVSGNQRLGNLPIAADNAYLPQSIKTSMAQLGYPFIFIGTNNLNGSVATSKTNVMEDTVKGAYKIFGGIVSTLTRQQFRSVASLDGSIGDNWKWNAYASHGQVRTASAVPKQPYPTAYNNAVDAVVVTAANVGTSGLPVGAVTCRSSLTAPTNGCVPVNVFGEHDVSPMAIDYVTNTKNHTPGGNRGLAITTLDVFGASMSGQLPAEWSLPAGPVAVAFGAEYRKEAAKLTSDPISKVPGWAVANYAAFAGHYSVAEGFAEVTVPVLKDNIVQSLEINAAGRITDYSTSGMVETWKLGLTSQVIDDIRLRATWSFDIRAPNINELFSTGNSSATIFVDPFTRQAATGFVVTGGNPNLKPEQATTISAGVVLTPRWVDGLSLSFDYYSISIVKAITTISQDASQNLCAAGDKLYCSQFFYKNGTLHLNSTPINAKNQSVSGLDFQSDYNFPFMDGSINLNLMGNYTISQSQLAQGNFFEYAGSIGSDSLVTGLPKLRSTLAATYDAGNWQATAQGRFIGEAKLNNAWGPLDVDDNNVPAVAYLDLRGSFNLMDGAQVYGAIDNVTNVPPQVYASTTAALGTGNGQIYDAIGRMFRLGVRVGL